MVPHADDEAPEASGAAADPQLGAAERQHEQQRRQDVDPEVGDHHDGEHVHLGIMVIVVTVTGLLTVLSQVPAPRSTPATHTVPVTSQHSSNRMYTAISGHEEQVVACKIMGRRSRFKTSRCLTGLLSLVFIPLLYSYLCTSPVLLLPYFTYPLLTFIPSLFFLY